ncbi:MAG: hypothetical protein MI919_25285 [Holophagales bacterium]|nr:hypothetical protein [Holophagales bacterium]
MTPRNHPLTALAALFGIALSALPTFAWPPLAPPPPATPEIFLSSDQQPVTELVVGRDLEVALLHGSPNTTYNIALRDEWGDAIASLHLQTSASGNTASTDLWRETGIVGCDPWAPDLDPLSYYFFDLPEAESHLPGRTFEVVVSVGLTQVASEDIDLVADLSGPVTYLSEHDGCTRHIYFETEEPFLTFVRVPAVTDTHVFLVPSQPIWLPGAPLEDVTEDGVSSFRLQPGTTTVSLGEVLPQYGPDYYDVIVRYGPDDSPFFDQLTDNIEHPYVPRMGTKTYKPCTGICPF